MTAFQPLENLTKPLKTLDLGGITPTFLPTKKREEPLCGQTKDRLDAEYVLEGLIRDGIQTYPAIGDKTRDAGVAGVAGVADHAAGYDLPVAAGGACRDDGDDRFGAATVLSLLPTRRSAEADKFR